jgi:hypothetical protein
VFRLKGVRATVLLETWLAWARRCRIPAFARLAWEITEHRAAIQAALTHGLSNEPVESANTKIRRRRRCQDRCLHAGRRQPMQPTGEGSTQWAAAPTALPHPPWTWGWGSDSRNSIRRHR